VDVDEPGCEHEPFPVKDPCPSGRPELSDPFDAVAAHLDVCATERGSRAIRFKDWQPRVSATYALGKNRTTLLRGSYARFADQLGFVGYQLNGLPGFYYYWTDDNENDRVDRDEVNVSPDNFCCFYNVDPTTAPIPPNAITSDFKTPLTDEVTIGIDRQIFEDFAVSATYTADVDKERDDGILRPECPRSESECE